MSIKNYFFNRSENESSRNNTTNYSREPMFLSQSEGNSWFPCGIGGQGSWF